MALIRSFAPSSQEIGRHSSEVDCEYVRITTPPEPVLHLSTFGSDARQSERKSSQSIQIDAARAAELVWILQDAFPGIVPRRPGS